MKLLQPLLRAADAPAHEAVRLARAPLHHTAPPLVAGVAALSAATLAVAALRGAPGQAGPAIGAVLEPIATLGPIAIVAAACAGTPHPRVVSAAFALGTLTAGWVTLGLVPLAAFVALVSQAGAGWALEAFALLTAIAAMGAVVLVVGRVIEAIDGELAWASNALSVALFSLFALRVWPWGERLLAGGLPW